MPIAVKLARRIVRNLVPAVLLSLVSLLPASVAQAADDGQVGIVPALGGDFLIVSALPGGTASGSALVTNHMRSTEHLEIYAVDARPTADGGIAFGGRNDVRSQVGSWLALTAGSLSLAPGSTVTVLIRIPMGTPAGTFAGAVIVQLAETKGPVQQVGHQTAIQLNIVQRVAMRVYVTVAGHTRSSIGFSEMKSHWTPAGLEFDVVATNTGNVTLHPTADLTLINSIDSSTSPAGSQTFPLLPGEQRTFRVVTSKVPSIFWGNAQLDLSGEFGNIDRVAPLHRLPVLAILAAIALFAVSLAGILAVTRWIRSARRAMRQVATSVSSRPRHADRDSTKA
jgi:hypothetical protein